jgi:hypothetical protein
VHCLPIGQKNDSEISDFSVVTHPRPAANAAIILTFFMLWKFHSVENPLVFDYGTVWSLFNGFEISGNFHPANLKNRHLLCNGQSP